MSDYYNSRKEELLKYQKEYYEKNKERLLEKRNNKGYDAAEFREYIRQLIKEYEENRTGTG